MGLQDEKYMNDLETLKVAWPEKFLKEEEIFSRIRAGDSIFVGTGCGEPQYLIQSLLDYTRSNPRAFLDAELMNLVTLGVAPCTDEKFRPHFRLNSFFISESTRKAVNKAVADYTPIFLSAVPDLIKTGKVPIDVVLIQASSPGSLGNMNLGISVDVTRAAVDKSELVVAQADFMGGAALAPGGKSILALPSTAKDG